jgi:hypothetical protein
MTMKITPKRRYPSTKLQDVIAQVTTIATLTALKTSTPIKVLGYDAYRRFGCTCYPYLQAAGRMREREIEIKDKIKRKAEEKKE